MCLSIYLSVSSAALICTCPTNSVCTSESTIWSVLSCQFWWICCICTCVHLPVAFLCLIAVLIPCPLVVVCSQHDENALSAREWIKRFQGYFACIPSRGVKSTLVPFGVICSLSRSYRIDDGHEGVLWLSTFHNKNNLFSVAWLRDFE